jgi:hypothetical protein
VQGHSPGKFHDMYIEALAVESSRGAGGGAMRKVFWGDAGCRFSAVIDSAEQWH